MTLPHFSVSSAMSLPKSAGDPAWTRNPRSSYLALISGRARDALISLLSTSMYSSARRGNRAASQFRKHLPSTSVLGSSGESRAILTKHSRRWTLNGTVSNTEVGKQPGVFARAGLHRLPTEEDLDGSVATVKSLRLF